MDRFESYSEEELRAAGIELLAAARKLATGEHEEASDTRRWTTFVLDYFEQKAPTSGVVVYPRRNEGRIITAAGEFLVDQCHVVENPYAGADMAGELKWYAELGPCKVNLAIESEWGKHNNELASKLLVLSDASKLCAVRATAKIMVFATNNGTNASEFVELLVRLRRAWSDDSPWLLLDLPWKERNRVWSTAGWVIAKDGKAQLLTD